MDTPKYKRNCSVCNKEIFYISLDSFNHSKPSTRCRYCCNVIRGKSSNRKGCHHTLLYDTKKRMSDSRKKFYNDPLEVEKLSKRIKEAMHRPEVRKKHIEGLHHSKWLKCRTDKGQVEMLDKWNRLGFSFEPNYQVHMDLDLFYIDGYDKEKNVVLEYDGKYHNTIGQKQKDLYRQQKIIELLKPNKFWRYNSENKTIKNVLEVNCHA